MSETGALIDGLDLPAAGTGILLKRGKLEASGKVAWNGRNRAGTSFEKSINVAAWMTRPVRRDQLLADAMVEKFRHNGRVTALEAITPDSKSYSEELLEIRDGLIRLGHSLTDDPKLVAVHPEIQYLDIAIQGLERMLSKFEGVNF